jgi:hypothetical protein
VSGLYRKRYHNPPHAWARDARKCVSVLTMSLLLELHLRRLKPNSLFLLARPAGLEPATSRFEVWCSIR